MSAGVGTEAGNAVADFNEAAAVAATDNRRKRSPLTVRLTPDERQRLKELAVGMTLFFDLFCHYTRALKATMLMIAQT